MGTQQTAPWTAWLVEALANYAAADVMQAAGYHSFSVCHSLMTIETAGKALRLAPLTWGDIDGSEATWDDLDRLTWNDLDGTSDPKTLKHHQLSDLLECPFLDKTTRDAVREELRDLRQKLGNRNPYLACRYPDQWGPGDPPPPQIITAADSHAARAAASMVLGACSQRFGAMAPDE